MKVLGGPKSGDFLNPRGFHGRLGERFDERAYLGAAREVVAQDMASLGPVASLVEEIPQVPVEATIPAPRPVAEAESVLIGM